MNLSQIDTNRIEGRLLIAALSFISTTTHRDKEPDAILGLMMERQDAIYEGNPLPLEEDAVATTFLHELTSLLNKMSKENESDTPDFALAKFLEDCLNAYSTAVKTRDKWFGVSMWDNQATEAKWND